MHRAAPSPRHTSPPHQLGLAGSAAVPRPRAPKHYSHKGVLLSQSEWDLKGEGDPLPQITRKSEVFVEASWVRTPSTVPHGCREGQEATRQKPHLPQYLDSRRESNLPMKSGFLPKASPQKVAARVFYVLVGFQCLLRVPFLLPSCASLCLELFTGRKEGKPPKVTGRANEACAGSQKLHSCPGLTPASSVPSAAQSTCDDPQVGRGIIYLLPHCQSLMGISGNFPQTACVFLVRVLINKSRRSCPYHIKLLPITHESHYPL